MADDTHHSHFGLIDTQKLMIFAERIKASESHFFLNLVFIVCVCFPCMYGTVLRVCLVLTEPNKRYCIPWNWSCRYL